MIEQEMVKVARECRERMELRLAQLQWVLLTLSVALTVVFVFGKW